MSTTDIIAGLSDFAIQQPSSGAIFAALLALLLLGLSAFCSGSEIAFFSLSPQHLDEIALARTKADEQIALLRKDSERTLATILIANNLVNVTIVMLLNYVFAQVVTFGPRAQWLEFLTITVLLTFLLLLFGEIMPKVYSRVSPLSFCRRVVGGVMMARRLFWPFASVLIKSGTMAERIAPKENVSLSVDDLEQALELTDKNDIRQEQSLLQGIIRFGDETVKDVMTSRQDIVDIDIRTSFDQVVACIVDNNYSRIPVYQHNADNIRGVLYIKDLLPHLGKPASFRWQTLIRQPYFVPETKKIDDLLREFQENHVHIAIVVDEFGGTSGLVTMEDVLEEIVGEINDEYDEDAHAYSKLSYNTFVFEGKTLLSDFFKVTHLDDDFFADVAGDADTLAGIVLELKGDFPSVHEIITYRHVSFEILELDDRRISKVKVRLNEGLANEK